TTHFTEHRSQGHWSATGGGVSTLLAPRDAARSADDQANRVASVGGASAPGRWPRLTNRIGAGAARAIARRVVPSPSLRQRSESPTTSRLAREAADTIPSRPGSA